MQPKVIHYLILAFFVILPFQNCSQPSSNTSTLTTQRSAFTFESAAGGNGEYYGGKLVEGTYLRPLPESKCGAKNSFGEIRVDKNGIAIGQLTNPNDCSVKAVMLDTSAVEFASYDPTRLGLLEGIYTRKEKGAPGISEAWCRVPGSTTQTGFDITVSADYGKSIFTSSVVVGRSVKGSVVRQEYASPNLSREVEIRKRIRYRGEGFRLDIDTQTFDRTTGKMRADFDFDGDGYDTEITVECRVGGELDVHFAARPYDL